MATAKEHGQRTTHAHDIFDCIEQQIAELSRGRDLFTDTISFTVIESKYAALRGDLSQQKWKTESLDAKKVQLIAHLKAQDGRIQVSRALLLIRGPATVQMVRRFRLFL
jgi:hypothetical protein